MGIRRRLREALFDLAVPRWRIFHDEEQRVTAKAQSERDQARAENDRLRAKVDAAFTEGSVVAGEKMRQRIADLAADLSTTRIRLSEAETGRDEAQKDARMFLRARDAADARVRELEVEVERLRQREQIQGYEVTPAGRAALDGRGK